MKSMDLSILILMLALLTGVMSNKCNFGENYEVMRQIVFENPNSTDWELQSMEYDSKTGDFFYFGHVYKPDIAYFISRMDYRENTIWSKAYNTSIKLYSYHNSFKYSPTYQMLYYILKIDPYILVQINSSNGELLNSFEVPGTYTFIINELCALSRDELAYFCNFKNSEYQNVFLRFDTSTSQIDIAQTLDASSIEYKSILGISRNEVLYGFNSKMYGKHHIIKASYDRFKNSFYEEYHHAFGQEMTKDAVSRMSQNNDTTWYAVSINFFLVYFQFDQTDFSLIGSKHVSSEDNSMFGNMLGMEVAEDIVSVYEIGPTKFVLFINATTQNPINMYIPGLFVRIYDIIIRNKAIHIIAKENKIGFHHEITANFSEKKLLYLSEYKYKTFLITDDYNPDKIVPLQNYSMNSYENLSTIPFHRYPNTVNVMSDPSIVLSKPKALNHSLIVYPSQKTLILDLPCKLDNYSFPFKCEVLSDPLPSWITINCLESEIKFKELRPIRNDPISFIIKSKFDNLVYLSSFDLTFATQEDFSKDDSKNKPIDQPKNETKQQSRNESISEITKEQIDETRKQPVNQTKNETKSETYQELRNKTQNQTTNQLNDKAINRPNDDSKYQETNKPEHEPIKKPENESKQKSTSNMKIARIAAGIVVCVGFILALFFGTSAQDSWAIIRFLQSVLILPLIAISINQKVQDFIVSNALVGLSMYILPLPIVKSIPLLKDLSFDQPDLYLKSLGLSSGSTLVNNFMLLIIISVIGIIHLTLYLMKKRNSGCKSTISKVYKFFTYSIYFRIAIELYMFTLLMLVSEIKYFFKNGDDEKFDETEEREDHKIQGNYVSVLFSCLILILSISLLLLTFILWITFTDETKLKRNLIHQFPLEMNEFCEGISHQQVQQQNGTNQGHDETSKLFRKIKQARLYYFIFLARRFILALILVCIPSSKSSFSHKIMLLFALQAVYMIYAISYRCFNYTKDQIVEISNESVLLILMIFIANFSSESKCNIISQVIFISIILMHLGILFVVFVLSTINNFVSPKEMHRMGYTTASTDQAQDNTISEEDKIESIELPSNTTL